MRNEVKWNLENTKCFIETNSGCKLLSNDVINAKSELSLLCVCGNEFKTTMKLFRTKTYKVCNECSLKLKNENSRLKGEKRFLDYLTHERNGEYILLSSYKSNKNKVLLYHIKCGENWLVKPNNIMSSHQNCPHCNPISNVKYTQEEIEEIIKKLVDVEYTVLGKYKGINEKIKMKHNKCGHVWDVTPKHFIHNDSRCPICASSKGETKIRDYLTKQNINFLEEYTFDDCRNYITNIVLRFDFAIFNGDNLQCLIEYDGEQHYSGWRGKDGSLSEIQNRDNIKNNYCKQNNIRLIRIPYWDFSNLEDILQHEISEVISSGQ